METFLFTLQLPQVCQTNHASSRIPQQISNYYLFIFVGSVNMMKLLVKKYGKEIAESVDAHKTKPIYFAAQEGAHSYAVSIP